ncbi:aspartyl protease family protein At5g10770-like [Aristolochia californica]|uniref:aspartyl protease family protein At5g10770-like n=1 Tax=Aristolochia californica TaxID=171875 RepID=UPI0035DEEF7A
MVLFFLVLYSFLLGTASPLVDNTTQRSCSALQDDLQIVNSSGIHLTLHHVHGPCSPVTLPPPAISDIFKRDEARIKTLGYRFNEARITKSTSFNSSNLRPESVDVPLTPGQSVGIGNYVVKLGLGTPPKYFIMVADTGSSFNWVQCEPCRIFCHPQIGPRFNPSQSHTYKAVQCGSLECSSLQAATLNPPACSNLNTCIYEASYGDTSYSVGYLSRDTLTLSSTLALPGFVYGCGQDNQGLFGQSAGLIGLARNRLSLLGQLSLKYGSVFSYCLPTMASSGSLSIGKMGFNPSLYRFTPMYTHPQDKTLYFLHFSSITVAGKALPLSTAVYTRTPTIIDSGTVITRLPLAVYSELQQAFVKAMRRYKQAKPFSILDTCFVGTFKRMVVPEVRLVFEGGAELKLAPQNTMIDVDGGVTCLALAGNRATTGVSIIGNWQQQTYRVAYDVENSRIGFSAGGCR